MQNGCAGVPESGAGNGRSICSGEGKHRRGSQPGCSFSHNSDSNHDLVPKRSRSGAAGGSNARTADSKIYRTSPAKIDNRLAQTRVSIFAKHLIGVAIQPTLPRLCGRDDRMSRRVRVFAGVPVRRAVAAKRNSTCLAGAQMNPRCADLYAFFAFTALRLFD